MPAEATGRDAAPTALAMPPEIMTESPPRATPSDAPHPGPGHAAAAAHGGGHARGHAHGHEGHGPTGSVRALTLAALGIVFGDIGTSPLYTLKGCLVGEHGAGTSPEAVLGVLSLIFWSLTLVVAVKYLTFIMRADNGGEGGILALLALVPKRLRETKRSSVALISVLVLVGAGLLYGDGIITPAISVLSAVEGLDLATDAFHPFIIPITCVILVGLFSIQSRGTGSVGRFFGPVMLLWFVTIGVLGAVHVASFPLVLGALSPLHAIAFFTSPHGWTAFPVLGGVVLAVTGGEALYADMGHFGPRPIRIGWWAVAMPGLVLNYLGQGALVLANPAALNEPSFSPFFAMVPQGIGTYALVALATCATVIASQALISGAFSLTHQAVQLGYFPRVDVQHTSREAEGQIYVPIVNWGIMIACVILVLAFQHSERLAAAYGIAVTGTMGITSIVYFVVTRETWGWPLGKSVPLLALFLSLDLPFFGANLLKFFEGGYVPILVGAAFFVVMVIWRRGRALLREHHDAHSPLMDDFLRDIDGVLSGRVPGIGIFMVSNSARVPPTLFHYAKRIRVLPETVVLMTVVTEHVPNVAAADRFTVSGVGSGIHRVIVRSGFMETPNAPELADEALARLGIAAGPEDITFYVGRETFLATNRGKMGAWSEGIFAFLSRNAQPATVYFAIPPEQVVELGAQIDL